MCKECDHRWDYLEGDDRESVICSDCGASLVQKFLLVEPSGEITEIEDPRDAGEIHALIATHIGEPTDRVPFSDCFARETGFLVAYVHDCGILDGLPMHRTRALAGLAGPAFLALDTGEELRGFGAANLELYIVTDILEDDELLGEEEAESQRKRASEWTLTRFGWMAR